MCDHKIYKNGEKIDISSGGILLRGCIKTVGAVAHNHLEDLASPITVWPEVIDGESVDVKLPSLKNQMSESKKFHNISQILQTKILR